MCAARRLPHAAPAGRPPETRHLFNAERLARCKKGIRIVNTARGELIDEAALAERSSAARSAAPALDVFEKEPPADWTLAKLPQVVATPHIAASTGEAQELVGVETAAAVRDFLRDGVIRNAVNFPSLPRRRVRAAAAVHARSPSGWARCVAQMGEGARTRSASATTARSSSRARELHRQRRASPGVLRPMLSAA